MIKLSELPLVSKTRRLMQIAYMTCMGLLLVVVIVTIASFFLRHVASEAVLEIEYRDYLNIFLLLAGLFSAVIFIIVSNKILPLIDETLRKINECVIAIKQGKYQPGRQSWNDPGIAALFGNIDDMYIELQRKRRAQQILVSGVAHELNTPLSVMRGHVSGMADGTLLFSHERLEIMDAEIGHMQKLVQDLLDLAQAEAGGLHLDRKKLNLRPVLQQIADFLQPMFMEKQQNLKLVLPEAALLVFGDEQRLRQVFVNLLVNACRYSDTGAEICLEAYRKFATDGENVVVKISDNGVGMTENELQRVFDYFYRTDNARKGLQSGRGIGLALSRQLVLAHDGNLTADSVLGEGTCFITEIPAMDDNSLN